MKVQHIRPKGYENLRAWCTDESNEYIGRRGVVFIDKKRYPEEDSVWANPYKIGKDGDRDEVLEKYEEYIWGKMGVGILVRRSCWSCMVWEMGVGIRRRRSIGVGCLVVRSTTSVEGECPLLGLIIIRRMLSI